MKNQRMTFLKGIRSWGMFYHLLGIQYHNLHIFVSFLTGHHNEYIGMPCRIFFSRNWGMK